MDHERAMRALIAAEAANWFVHMREEDGRDTTEAFAEWQMRSPTHIEEFLAVSYVWAALNISDEGEFRTTSLIEAAQEQNESANVVRLRTYNDRCGAPSAAPRMGLNARRWAGIAAAFLGAIGGWLGYVSWHQADEYSTAVGEQRSVSLTDGSVVFLNTESGVRVRWTTAERHIDLIRGEARFQVAKNPARPFVVATQQAAVRAVGTIFNVRADPERTQVAVIEGRVVVSARPEALRSPRASVARAEVTSRARAVPSMELAAGERAAVTLGGIEPNVGASIEGVSAWTQRRLVFRAQSLGDVVAEFNRYRTQRLYVDDAQLAALRISGSFDPSDPESLIAYLQDFETVRVERNVDGSVHLARRIPTSKVPR